MRKLDDIKVENPDSPWIKFSWLILFTVLIALSGLVIHEYNHVWAGAMCGDTGGEIYFDFEYVFGIPIPVTGFAGHIPTNWFTLLAGGLFTGIAFIIVGLWARWTKSLHDYYVEFSFMLVGLCHLFYCIWEVTMLHNISFAQYSLGANIIYGSTIVAYILIMRNEIKAYLYGCRTFVRRSIMW